MRLMTLALAAAGLLAVCAMIVGSAGLLAEGAVEAASKDTRQSMEMSEGSIEEGKIPKAGPSKSYGLYVGKELTSSGDTLLAGSGEEVSSHWLEIVPREEHAPGETIKVGVTKEATIPGELIEIPQVEETNRYITMNYSDFEGFPAPLTNGGLNDQGVAIRDIWSPSRTELIEMTPTPQRGPQYSVLARIALERANCAREAVEIIGRLVDEHGYSTYGGNSHLIADEDEGWVMIQAAGGEDELAREYLTDQSSQMALEGLDLGSIEARAELLYGIQEPEGDEINASFDEETVNCLVGADPDLPPQDQ